jgi:hypothetical protein
MVPLVRVGGMNLAEFVEANREKKRPVLSDRTVNRYLSSLSAFCSWAEANGVTARAAARRDQPRVAVSAGKRCIAAFPKKQANTSVSSLGDTSPKPTAHARRRNPNPLTQLDCAMGRVAFPWAMPN